MIVDVTGDGLPEADDTFNLVLSAPTGAVIADAAGTAVNEGNTGTTQVTFTVTRTGNTTGASSVKVRTSGGTATASSDYTAVPLTEVVFAASETTKTVTVDITGDTVKEANESVNLALTTPVGATVSDAAGTATIIRALCADPVHDGHRGSGTCLTLSGRGPGSWATLAPVPG